jgi:cholesterol oxidase
MSGTLSRPLSEMVDHYTVVVVGSGYGAGVAASRLARAGQRVCLLERGREIRPGSYPNELADAREQFQISTSRGRIGPADAMFELHVNEDMFALVGCGLGGTSLINANVALEIDQRLLQMEHWPTVFQAQPHLLEPYYQRARTMLDPSPYPEGRRHYPPLGKVAALEKAAKAMGKKEKFYRPPITVNFENKTNPFGVPQLKCTNCGDCCSGCNVGAKNTTLMNYLPDAVNHGAEIYTGAHVDWLERNGNTWRVHYTEIDGDKPGVVSADYVVLGAGSLGSTGILLRSREKGLSLSEKLGESFSGNGDVLAFGYDAYWKTNQHNDKSITADPLYGVGIGTNNVARSNYPGPCIAGIIDLRDCEDAKEDANKGLVIEEGVPPGAVVTALPPAFFFADALAGSFTRFGLDEVKPRLTDAKKLGESFQKDPGSIGAWAYKGPVARTESFLVMSVDSAAGKLVLQGDRVAIDWPGAGDDPAIVNDNSQVSNACDGIQAQFFPNPIWTGSLGRKVITVHPVGGCGMGNNSATGVIDERCRVYVGTPGSDVHHGLYVCDGAAMPGPVGVNPLLTITAVAERAMELLAEDAGWTIDFSMDRARPYPPFQHLVSSLQKIAKAIEDGVLDEPKKLIEKLIRELIRNFPDRLSPQFQFTETMRGFVSTVDDHLDASPAQRISDDYTVAAAWGRCRDERCEFTLTMHSDDLNALTSRPDHIANISGTVTCPALAEAPMKVLKGEFRLLTVKKDLPESWRMTYDMVLDRDGNPVRFHGYKVLQQRGGSDPWTDLTTLFVTINDKEDGSGPLLAQGILTLGIEDLMWQSSSAKFDTQEGWVGALIKRVPRVRNAIALAFIAQFAAFFGMTVFQAYGGMLATLNNFPAKETAPPARALRAPKPKRFIVKTKDHFKVGLTRYFNGGAKGPVVLAPGFSVRASSFATTTVDENLVEYLVARDYDVWLFDYRASGDSGNPTRRVRPFTIDDIAQYDWPAALAKIREVSGKETVQAMAHCVGSLSLLMGLACGKVTGVSSMIASQLTLHPVTDWMNYMKADLGMAQLMSNLGKVGQYFDFSSGNSDTDHMIDAIAYNLPVPAGQACKNPTCRRVFGVYGPSYDHAQLSHDTHIALASMFSRVSTKPFEQLQIIMQAGRALAADGRNIYLTDEGAARLALPITFLAGLNNQIFYPESSQRTLAWLELYNGPSLYRQRAIPGYAHMDLFIGQNSAEKVFSLIVEELQRLEELASQ